MSSILSAFASLRETELKGSRQGAKAQGRKTAQND